MLESIVSRSPEFVSAQFDREMLFSIASMLEETAAVPGSIVIAGCPQPLLAAWINFCTQEMGTNKKVFIFEPFATGPLVGPRCRPVDLANVVCDSETGVSTIMDTMDALGLSTPEIVAGWFFQTIKESIPEEISFVHVNCGLHEEILETYLSAYDKLSPGAIVCVNGYGSGWTKCVKDSTDEFLAYKPEKAQIILHNSVGMHATFKKKGEVQVETTQEETVSDSQ